MVVLNFTLSPEAASKVHDLLVCLAKFSDTVALEARPNSLSFTALNPSKSAYAAITLGDRQPFFEHYEFVPSQRSEGRFTCGMYIKALLSVFRGRLFDPQGRDGAIDRCEVSVQESPNEAQCRFTVKMICNQGIIKTYRLTYEAVDVLHAMFDRTAAKNKWTMHASAIREYTEYFGTKTEMLDLFAGEDGRCVFKSYTEKVSNGKEILKHPLVTAVAVNTSDFAEFTVQAGLHIIVSVKDFKAIVAHADVLKTTLRAQFSQPTRPLQFSYESGGLSAEFTLMTSGDVNAIPPSPTPVPRGNASRQASHKSSSGRTESRSSRPDMPPPSQPASRRDRLGRLRNPGSRQSSSSTETATAQQDTDSLFVPDNTEDARRREDEEELQWAPRDYDREETLGWDANADMDASIFPTFRDSGNMPKGTTAEDTEVFEPTQRVSQMNKFALW